MLKVRNTIFLFLIFFTQIFPQNYKLVWSDEFNDSTLNQANWTYEIGNNNGWGNGELEYYTNRLQNCSEHNGILNITAQKESYYNYGYTSTRIKTQGKFSIAYGKIEARMKLPFGQGMWPAFWMLGDNITQVSWPYCGEIDIMEMIGGQGGENTVYGSAHWYGGNYSKSYKLASGTFADAFHVYDVTWTPTQIVWHVDGIIYNTLDITPSALNAFQKKFFIILNLAVGGGWPGNPDSTTIFPQSLQIDYVRVYADSASYPSTTIESPLNNSTFNANSNILITANASYPKGDIKKVEFYQDHEKIGETDVSPYQMTWNNVSAGNYKIRSIAYTNDGLSIKSDFTNITVGGGANASPYGGTPAQIPGTIEAENYDLGGQNVSFGSTAAINTGGFYRLSDGIDIEQCTDINGGYDVFNNQLGEWMQYTVNVNQTGTYQISARVASILNSSAMHFEVDGTNVTGTINVTSTGGWQTWSTVTSNSFNLQAGTHTIKLVVESGLFSINKFDVYPPNTAPSINLLYPTGGEQLASGNIINIKWTSALVNQVEIGYTTNGGTSWSFITTGTEARFGVWRWKVPSITSTDCKIIIFNKDNVSIKDSSKSSFSISSSINAVENNSNTPMHFSLDQNYPNPFNPTTSISFQLSKSGFVTLKVFDVLGNVVSTLVNGYKSEGKYSINFDASHLTSGIYYYQLRAEKFLSTKKMLLMK